MTLWTYIHLASPYVVTPILIAATLDYGTWFLRNMAACDGDSVRRRWVVWGTVLWLAFWVIHLLLLLRAHASKDVMNHWVVLNFVAVFYLWCATRTRVAPARIVVPIAALWSALGAVLWILFAAGVLPIGYIHVGYSTLGPIVLLCILVPALLFVVLGGPTRRGGTSRAR